MIKMVRLTGLLNVNLPDSRRLRVAVQLDANAIGRG